MKVKADFCIYKIFYNLIFDISEQQRKLKLDNKSVFSFRYTAASVRPAQGSWGAPPPTTERPLTHTRILAELRIRKIRNLELGIRNWELQKTLQVKQGTRN